MPPPVHRIAAPPPSHPPPAAAAWPVALAAALALAVAMGIGRFAFTPLLPLMQREGLLDADGGAALAAANYLGYLAGALSAGRLAARPRPLVLASLLATAGVTAAIGAMPGLVAWLVLRTLAGVLSAWVMVGVSTWAIAELARRGRADASGAAYAGVGLGIGAAGLLAWWRAGDGAAVLWGLLGALALLASAFVAACWRPATAAGAGPAASGITVGTAAPSGVPAGAPSRTPADPPAHRPAAAPARPGSSEAALITCYGLFGFGYILPATYLPALARTVVDDPRLFGLAWPLFGAAAAASTLLAGRWLTGWRRQDIWAGCHLLLAAGCVLPLAGRSLVAIGAAALAVGASFMVATMAGLQLARARAAADPAPLLARMVAAFALGQICGPLLALAISRLSGAGDGITPTLALAAAALLGSAAWLRWKLRDHESPADDNTAPRLATSD